MPRRFALITLLFMLLSGVCASQPTPRTIPPHLLPILKKAKSDARQGQDTPEVQKARFLMQQANAAAALPERPPTSPASTPEKLSERQRLEQHLQKHPSDRETRLRLLDLARQSRDTTEIARHESILSDTTAISTPFWKIAALVILIALVLWQLCLVLHEVFGRPCPFSRPEA
ncbi:MAG: hypothetical protein AB1744_05850 [Candidatus Zixiibacteriota bacterium]